MGGCPFEPPSHFTTFGCSPQSKDEDRDLDKRVESEGGVKIESLDRRTPPSEPTELHDRRFSTSHLAKSTVRIHFSLWAHNNESGRTTFRAHARHAPLFAPRRRGGSPLPKEEGLIAARPNPSEGGAASRDALVVASLCSRSRRRSVLR